jgi:hypothetical protein
MRGPASLRNVMARPSLLHMPYVYCHPPTGSFSDWGALQAYALRSLHAAAACQRCLQSQQQ